MPFKMQEPEKMKYVLLFMALLSCSIFSIAQKPEDPGVLDTDSSWKKEIFHFPLNFAKEINYTGIEDARFPTGWGNKDSVAFWSYAFAWHINLGATLTERELESNLQIYFDGLMRAVNSDKEAILESTIALFIKKGPASDTPRFVGKIRVFDAFFTKKPMILNVLVDRYFCKQEKNHILLFRFSPREFESEIWKKLKEVKLRANSCTF